MLLPTLNPETKTTYLSSPAVQLNDAVSGKAMLNHNDEIHCQGEWNSRVI